jgi:hypothetical protein
MLCCAEYNHRIRWNSTGTYVNITIVLWIVTSRACFPLQTHIRCINSVRCNYTRSIYRTFPAPTDARTTDVVTCLITALSTAFYSVRVPLVHLSSVFCGLILVWCMCTGYTVQAVQLLGRTLAISDTNIVLFRILSLFQWPDQTVAERKVHYSISVGLYLAVL